LFWDLTGSIHLGDALRGEDELYDEFFDDFENISIETINKYNGIYNKTDGDSVLSYFDPKTDPNHALNAIKAARAMMIEFEDEFLPKKKGLWKEKISGRIPSIGLKCGISTGKVRLKQSKSPGQLPHLIGDEIIVTKRIAKQARKSSDNILVSQTVMKRLPKDTTDHGFKVMKYEPVEIGSRHVPIYEIIRTLQDALPSINKEITIVFWDISGSTELGNVLRGVEQLYNDFIHEFELKSAEILKTNEGKFNKFDGDSVLSYFDPETDLNHALNAILAARAMMNWFKCEFLPREESNWKSKIALKIPPVGLKCGISCGEVNIRESAVLNQPPRLTGDDVNVAKRIAELAKKSPGNILVSQTVSGRIKSAEKIMHGFEIKEFQDLEIEQRRYKIFEIIED